MTGDKAKGQNKTTNQQMQVKAVSCKEAVKCEHNPEMWPPSLDQSTSKMI